MREKINQIKPYAITAAAAIGVGVIAAKAGASTVNMEG